MLERQEAIAGWKTPLFGSYYHQTGYVVAATIRAPAKATEHLEKALSSIASHPAFAKHIQELKHPDDFRDLTWQYTGLLTGFKGYYNRLAGYAHSSDALRGIAQHCVDRNVHFVLGDTTGRVDGLIYKNDGGRCVGIRTADGTEHHADTVICALGAHDAVLLPSLAKLVTARCWSVAHVQLIESETNWLRGIPTTNVRDLGFFFEPDPKTKLFKICPLGAGLTNTNSEGSSLPPRDDEAPHDLNYTPAADEKKLRQLLRETFPWMADRPFVHNKMCWFADTADSEYCIDFVPGSSNSLVVLSGASGHGSKMMPVFGKWVAEFLVTGFQKLERWRWRDADMRGKDWASAVSWRIGQGMDWKDFVKESEEAAAGRGSARL